MRLLLGGIDTVRGEGNAAGILQRVCDSVQDRCRGLRPGY